MSVPTRDTPDAPACKGLHHAAFLCRDPEETRKFYEEVLGFRLVAAVVLPSGVGLAAAYAADLGDGVETDEQREMLTMFIEVSPERFITFFDVPDTLTEKKFKVRDGVEEYHLAFELESWTELRQMKQRMEAFGVPVSGPVDLQANYSIYFYDPNGIHLEFTIRSEAYEQVYAYASQNASAGLAEWMEKTKAVRSERLAGSAGTRTASEKLKRSVIDRIISTVSMPDQPHSGPAGTAEGS